VKEQHKMFHHEKLDVYQVSLSFVQWSYELCKNLKGVDRHARDQLIRASHSIPLNIAEGNGKLPSADRQRYNRIALGSALECAAALDILRACKVIDEKTVASGKALLVRIVSMLTKMASASMQVREDAEYGLGKA
jgi:four helix bundle protein